MEGADQLIEGVGCILFSGISEMGVESGCGRTAVAEKCLNMAQAQALLKQMGGQ